LTNQRIADTAQLAESYGHLHRQGIRRALQFQFGTGISRIRTPSSAGGPGRHRPAEKDYYFRDDAKAVETRKEYVAHLVRVLQLMGVAPAAAAKQADAVMALETALGKGVSRRHHAAAIPEKGLPQMNKARLVYRI